ncbi:MAG: tetratricopeptide repeat protein [Ferrovibrio sp.]|uniref:tetratricopeptide repeat protein n=1 Tax=Ferrovibrio sp. TaxID=1917215 RepID=UPI00391951BB
MTEDSPAAPSADLAADLAAALAQAEAVLAQRPDDPALLDLAAGCAEALGDLAKAEDYRRRGVQVAPQNPAAWIRLATLLQQRYSPEKAAAVYRRAIDLMPNDPHLHHALGSVQERMGHLGKAEYAYRRSVKLAPDPVFASQALNDYASVLTAQQRHDEAEAAYRAALARSPYAKAANNLASLYHGLGKMAEAEQGYRHALELKPNYPHAEFNLANLLHEQGRLAEAEDAYRRAIARDPGFTEAMNNLGLLLGETGRSEEAIALLRLALHQEPQHAAISVNLADLLHQRGDADDAKLVVDAALLAHPDDALLRLTKLMHCLPALPDSPASAEQGVQAFDAELQHWTQHALQPGNRRAAAEHVGHKQPFYLAYRAGDHRLRLSAFGDATAALMRDAFPLPSPQPPARQRIRLCVVTKYIRSHSVWTVVLNGLLSQIDRTRFETVLLHTGTASEADMAAVRGMVDRLYPHPRDFRAALDILRGEQPDILYYPEIGMDALTNRLANLRLAPVQAAGWGHPVTTGLPEIDLYLSGDLLEPPNAARHYRERLVRLPGTGACTLSPPVLPMPLPPEIAALLPSDRRIARFVLCQHAFKFDPADDALYARIARAAGPCRIFIMLRADEPVQSERLLDRLRQACARIGVDGDSVFVSLPWLPMPQFYSLLDEMDVYLDCPGFSGYTTAWQALHRGLPIVTLEGGFMRQRLAAGALRQIDTTETIAGDAEQYLGIATALAQECRGNAPAYAVRRAALRGAAPKLDGNAEVVRVFETVLAEELERRR